MQRYARIAGVLLLISMFAGFFGEAWVPSKVIVSGDPAATARNLASKDMLFRLGFAAYLIEAVCDISLSLLFYLLLRRVREDLALLSVLFGLVSTAVYAVAELSCFAASLLLRGAGTWLKAFSPDQVSSLALLALKLFAWGGSLFMVFYGIASVIRGHLIYRSGYLPRVLGILMELGGLGFIAKSFTMVLAPAYSSDLFYLPMAIAGIPLTVWLLAKGIDTAALDAAAT